MGYCVDKQRAWEDLAGAIIQAAAEEYRAALIHLKRNPQSEKTAEDVKELERFFFSRWFATLTELEPSYLIRQMKKTIDEKYGQSEGI